MTPISHREEFLFLYDVTMANPNGDPLEENKPRIDEASGLNLVTDVRLKRTIRDHFHDAMGHDGRGGRDIFVRQTASDKGTGIKDGKARVKDFGDDSEAILARCIDIRLFGGVLPLNKRSFTFTGPAQLKMGRSLHRVHLMHLRGTGAFASSDGNQQNTFRDEYILPYSLICFYGVINEHAAKHTGLGRDDVDLFYEAMWEGTRNLLSRSKMGHMPRFLLRLRHGDPNFFIGDLDHLVRFRSELDDEAIRKHEDGLLDLSALAEELAKHEDRIETIEIRQDERLKVVGWNR
ncbi:type I-B CRISPR-associated protein Cas7/Csh2 [Sulfidibacter corallicola]|uniref:Type I-B CRISPR-associated protein Cas7/Csh2 n=1 Tax=Sulfidibacter corallicola TaxID=2818388 RepID=A0A8A4TN33_SULCO|nr:type I-B CRISPR-associated protein Cas7/Csh2 [Sulfidibacter corallicola]QTD50950.1 type I-B CRISPR-associated protein Cas7/Csh2 [Sulfidibacter corallicola]